MRGDRLLLSVGKDLAVSHLMVFQGSSSFLEGFFADGGNAGMTYLPMRAGVKDEENIISSFVSQVPDCACVYRPYQRF